MNAVRTTILLCDEVPEPDRSRHGDTDEQLRRHLLQAAELAGLRLSINVVDVRRDPPPPAATADLFVITGSATDPFADTDWVVRLRDWVRSVQPVESVGHFVRLFGICFGHQIIAHALGGSAARAVDWEVGGTDVERLLRLLPGGKIGPGAGSVRLLMSHQDEVVRLPPLARRWLTGGFCAEQGFVVPGRIATLQGHPEWRTAQASDLYRRRRPRLGDVRSQEAVLSSVKPHDGVALTAECLAHLLG